MRIRLLKNILLATFALTLLPSCALYSPKKSDTKTHYFKLINTLNQHDASRTEKIDQLTESLMGIVYVDGNLGEGKQGKFDQDPLLRFDAFDCTTYVETIIAGVTARDASEFLSRLTQLRYQDGEISFLKRNHFPSVDWLPNNQSVLKEVTPQVGAEYTLYAHTVIDKKAWYQRMGPERIQLPDSSPEQQAQALQQLRKAGAHLQPEPVNTPYIPLTAIFIPQQVLSAQIKARQQAAHSIVQDNTLDNLKRQQVLQKLALKARQQDSHLNQALLDRIPSGSVISIVRPNYKVKQWIGTNMNITHQAIAVRRNGQLYLRHASQLQRQIVEQDFIEYFAQYLLSPSVKGFNVQEIRP